MTPVVTTNLAVDPRPLVAVLFQANLPVLLWGDPGIGKTAFVKQLIRMLGISLENFVTFIGSMYQPEDIGGFPSPDHDAKVFDYLAGRWVTRLQKVLSALFLDELNTGSPAMQAAMLRVIHERMVGEHRILGRVIAAANPVATSAGGMEVGLALRNRFAHVNFDINGEWWLPAKKNGWKFELPVLRRTWVDGVEREQQVVDSFLEFRPELRNSHNETDMASASPRSWDHLARFVAAGRSVGLDSATLLVGCQGIVGTAPGMEYHAYAGMDSKVGIRDLIYTPNSACATLKTEPADVRNALFGSVQHMRTNDTIGDQQVEAIFTAAITAGLDLGELQGHWSRIGYKCAPDVRTRIATAITQAQVAKSTGGKNIRGSVLDKVAPGGSKP